MDKLCHIDNYACSFRKKESDGTVVKLLTLAQSEVTDNISSDNKLCFLIKGKIALSFANHIDSIVNENNVVCLPVEQHYSLKALEPSTLLVIRTEEQISFCNCLNIEDLYRHFESENYTSTDELYILEINPEIKYYIEFILFYLDKGICCEVFYKGIVKELFFLLRFFYSKKELSLLFHRVLSPDSKFYSDIMRNSHKCKSVIELAQTLNYSVSGFEKHFKQIFGISPYKWMLQDKAEKVYCEIRLEKQDFKRISSDFGFSSISHFTNFCKTYLGTTPSNIRKYGRVIVTKPEKEQSS